MPHDLTISAEIDAGTAKIVMDGLDAFNALHNGPGPAKGEDAAREQGCTRSRLATMTFQAPEFYIKRGYVEICRLPDVPPGDSYIWMSKAL